MHTRSLLAAVASAALLIAAAPAGTDVKAGVDAWMDKNFTGAVHIWRPLADKGDADAQFNMGQAYKLGRGVPTDLKIAQSWYEKAAQQGHEKAQANLGLLLFQNGQQPAAMPWIRKAADRGDPRAQYVLGTAMFNGDYAVKDWPTAYALMTRAAAQGLPPAGASVQQMDKYIPIADREKGIAIARRLEQTQKSTQVAANAGDLPASKVLEPAPATRGRPAPDKPAPKATATRPPALPVAAPTLGGGWRVQLGAYGSAAGARSEWSKLSGRIGALAGLRASYEPAGSLTRLRVGPFASRAAAERICAAAKAAGQACFPIAP